MALRLSIVVIGFDMKRELPRTVVSLLPPYQQGVHHDEVEIIVVDNGSAEPVCRDWFPEEAAIRVERVKGGVSALGGSYISGVLKVPSETAFCVMKTALFHEINGYDERFVQLGGGLASFEFSPEGLGGGRRRLRHARGRGDLSSAPLRRNNSGGGHRAQIRRARPHTEGPDVRTTSLPNGLARDNLRGNESGCAGWSCRGQHEPAFRPSGP